jgi:outer membrane protein TolC
VTGRERAIRAAATCAVSLTLMVSLPLRAQLLPDTQLSSPPGGNSLPTACGDGEPMRPVGLEYAVAQSLHLEPKLMMARANELESKSEVRSAFGGFLPSIRFTAVDERYVPSNGSAPVVVVDNTVLGGAQTKSAYASLGLNWKLFSSGRDVAAYRGARADVRAAGYGVSSQMGDTLFAVLQAYADLYEAEVAARAEGDDVLGLRAIEARAGQRFAKGYGTSQAIGRARVATLRAERSLNGACRRVEEKSAALSRAIGRQTDSLQMLSVTSEFAPPPTEPDKSGTLAESIAASPAVAQAREELTAARDKLHRALREFGPTVSLSVQRDYLGQSVDSFGMANHHIAPADYRIGLEFTQPLFPLTSEGGDVERARAQVRKAQARYAQARLDAESQLIAALSARREAELSLADAQTSLEESEQVLRLTEARYRAGRTDLDDVQHAEMDRNDAAAAVRRLAAEQALADWGAIRSLRPGRFRVMLLRSLDLEANSSQ